MGEWVGGLVSKCVVVGGWWMGGRSLLQDRQPKEGTSQQEQSHSSPWLSSASVSEGPIHMTRLDSHKRSIGI